MVKSLQTKHLWLTAALVIKSSRTENSRLDRVLDEEDEVLKNENKVHKEDDVHRGSEDGDLESEDEVH
jgi:hypothetical protein